MDERAEIASRVLAGMLIGIFGDRPTAKPPALKTATIALEYADALREALRNSPETANGQESK